VTDFAALLGAVSGRGGVLKLLVAGMSLSPMVLPSERTARSAAANNKNAHKFVNYR
jgi:hypothetical protein